MSDWKWSGPDATEGVVIPSVQAVAVYTNQDGDIVIRQEGAGHGDTPEDQVIFIPRSMAKAIAKAVSDELKKPFDPTER